MQPETQGEPGPDPVRQDTASEGWTATALRLTLENRWVQVLGSLLILALPWMTGNFYTSIANFFAIYVLLGLSINIIVGYTGLFQLGHAAFYAVGAYTTAILSTAFGLPFWPLFIISGITAALFAWLTTAPILHLRGDYLCIVTIGIGEVVQIALTQNVFGITGGPNGIFGVSSPSLFGFSIQSVNSWYYFLLVLVVILVAAMIRLEDSRVGRAWEFIREDDVAASAMGIDVRHYKLIGFVLGAAIAGAVGALYASMMTVVSPEGFSFWESVIMFSIVILGGSGSIPGIIVGAFALEALPQLFRFLQDSRLLVFGIAMVVMMIFRPDGLVPARIWRRVYHGRKGAASLKGDAYEQTPAG